MKKIPRNMNNPIPLQQLESYLWGAATLLRGTIDAGDYKQFIFPLLFYKRICDVFDEETETALKESGGDKTFAAYRENHRFQVPHEAHWFEVRQTSNNVGQALQSAMRTIETANPEKLYGIFGDAQWTNKDRLSDAMLRDLVEHFSSFELTLANLPEDELGQGYEYLIKKFADDAGHTAAEFYTNRTVVHLMTEMLEPQPGESIYDPTCGSGGMLLSCITHLRRQGKEWRNVRLYGQERNLMTSSIARMNCFLHGIEDFQIVRGDTLSEPKFVEGDRLMRFDVVLANPPYSIKQWDRDAFASDPWGRNLYGTPPQGRADYAFWQHILCSLSRKSGRCAILFPHGVLFRQEESEMRRKLIETDIIECVLGLGPNLFYNSPMEACVVICRAVKPKGHKGRILFINAVNEVTRERAQSFLTDDHIEHIVKAYEKFKDEPGFTRVATLNEIRKQGGNLNISLYLAATEPTPVSNGMADGNAVRESLSAWLGSASEARNSMDTVLGTKLGPDELPVATKIVKALPGWLKRSEWKRLSFGTFTDSVNERIEPADAMDEIYVGLDDLDAGNLHIRGCGKGSDVIGTKLRFRKGDVIFGRRRAYQRKLVIAEVDGICSAHAIVARAKPKVVLPEFLPFFMMSDLFMKRAVEISVGSLSPTINWTTLRIQEFDLPPVDQQRCIAEILWAVDDLTQIYLNLLGAMQAVLSATNQDHFEKMSSSTVRLSTAVQDSAYGPRFSSSLYAVDGELAQLRTTDMSDEGEINYATIPRVDLKATELSRHILEDGDFLISRSGTCGIGAVYHDSGIPTVPGAFLIRLRLNDRLSPDYLREYVNSPTGRKHILRLTAGGVQKNIRGSALLAELVPMPNRADQERFLERCRKQRACISAIQKSIAESRSLLMSIVNTL